VTGDVIRPTFRPPGVDADDRAGTLLLRDGTFLPLQRAVSEDAQRIGAFLERLAAPERRTIGYGLRVESEALPAILERLSERETGEAFIAEDAEGEQVAGLGIYRLDEGSETGAVAVAVAPELRGQALASLLLERLVVLAARRGVRRLVGEAPVGAETLGHVLRRGGFVPIPGGDDRVTWELDLSRANGDEGVKGRAFTQSSLRALFYPKSVGVIGASRNPQAVGHRIVASLVRGGFEGPVYPINPKAAHIASVPAFPSLAAVGRPISLAVIAVPAAAVLDVLEECAEQGVRSIVLVSAGFAEVGAGGRALQDAVVDKVRAHGMRLIGPNCLGMIHTHPDVRLNASFAPELPPHGRIALSSQSGALGVAIIALARSLGLGLSSFVSVGNKADVSGNDLLEYWEEDPETDVILLYLESFGNPRRFARIARRVGRVKTIVTVKAGRSEAGSRAASSHTAALSAPDTGVQAMLDQTGVIRADTLEEMFGIARALTEQPLPAGRRVAIVTNAGGPAILAADALEAGGLVVAELSEAIQQALQSFLPAAASTHNPVDMIASAGPEAYGRAVEIVLADPEIDALVVIYTPVGMFSTVDIGVAIAEGVLRGRETAGVDKPIYGNITGLDASGATRFAGATAAGPIPIYPFPEVIGRVLGKVADYAEWRRSDPGVFPEFADQHLDRARQVCLDALAERGGGWLSAEEARAVLDAAGITSAPGGVARDPDEAASLAQSIGFPVAVKLVSLEITHKTDIGAVVLGLKDAAAVRDAFGQIRARVEEQDGSMQGVLVQPMLEGTEVMIGVNADSGTGPLVVFGLGGIYVEVLRDVVFRVSPLTDRDAREMVRRIRGNRLLQGYRGHPAADVETLHEALLRISRLVETVPEIRELDLNPLFALEPGRGYRVVDSRIRVGTPPARTHRRKKGS